MKSRIFAGMLIFWVAGGLCSCALDQQSGARRAIVRMKAKDYFKDPTEARFVEAVGAGNVQVLSGLVQQGVDVNAVGLDGMRPLFWALGRDNLTGFEFLLRNKADPNISTGDAPGDSGSVSVMEMAAIAANPRYLQLALEYGGDPDFPTYGNRTIIFEAIMNSRTQNVRALVNAGADMNNHRGVSGTTPIQLAAVIGKFDIVYMLLMAGADPNIKNKWGKDLAAEIADFRPVKRHAEQLPWLEKVSEEMRNRHGQGMRQTP